MTGATTWLPEAVPSLPSVWASDSVAGAEPVTAAVDVSLASLSPTIAMALSLMLIGDVMWTTA